MDGSLGQKRWSDNVKLARAKKNKVSFEWVRLDVINGYSTR